jgi:hypothetical protein
VVWGETGSLGLKLVQWWEYKLEDTKRKVGRDGSLGRSFSPFQMGRKKRRIIMIKQAI